MNKEMRLFFTTVRKKIGSPQIAQITQIKEDVNKVKEDVNKDPMQH